MVGAEAGEVKGKSPGSDGKQDGETLPRLRRVQEGSG